MKKRIASIIIGIIVLAVGIILVGNIAGFWNIDLLFKGWWIILVMAASLISMISDKPNIFNVYFLLFGGAMLLKVFGVIGKDVSGWLIALALLIVVAGVKLIISAFSASGNSGTASFSAPESQKSTDGGVAGGCNVTFSEQNINFNGMRFSSAKYECAFGKLTLDLRGALIDDNAFLYAECSFGSVVVIVPPDTAVRLDRDAVFGSVKNSASSSGAKTLNIKAEAVFGSVNIMK